MPKITAIAFDWSGVILQGIDKSFADSAATFLGIDTDVFRRAYFLHNHMINKGKDSKSFTENVEMWSNILSELGLSARLDDFVAFVRSRPQGEVSQPIVDLIQRLKNAGWKLGLLSNTSAEGAIKIRTNDCVKLFDAALYSAEINTMKPEHEAFNKLARALNVPMNELIFIDDSARSLSTAAELGYTPIHFTSNEQLISELAKLGIAV